MLRSLWLLALGCCVWFGASACTHTAQETSGAVKAEAAETPTSCASSVLCTMELAPQICTFQGKTFEANNRCQAMVQMRAYACEQKLAFAEDQVTCKSHPAMQVEGAGACGRRMICTREYDPHICTLGEHRIKGPNRCEALNKAREMACEKGLAFVAEEVPCQPEPKERGKAKAKKR